MVSNDPNFPDTGLQIKPSNDSSTGEWDVKDSQEDIETFGIAGRVWEAAYAARRFFSEASMPDGALELEPTSSLFETPTTAQDFYIVELGAGAGYGGLHLSKCLHRFHQHVLLEFSQYSSSTPRLILTDLPNVMPLLERNIAQTLLADDGLCNTMKIEARPCAWGDEGHARAILETIASSAVKPSQGSISEGLTHILAADLVYFPELFPPLLRSLIWLSEHGQSTGSGPEVIFTYKVRSLVKEQSFWMVFCAWFQCEPVYCRQKAAGSTNDAQNKWRRFGERRSDLTLSPAAGSSVGALEDDDEADQQVYVFIARRKPHTLGWLPADDDGALMQGQRHRRDSATGELQTERELDDMFEMILMNSVML